MSGSKSARTAEALLELALAGSRLHFASQQAGRGIGAVDERNAGVWSVLHSLAQSGARTVPQLARERPVTRQYMQMIVNELEAAGLVRLIDNPAHKRSRLVELTPAGAARHVAVLGSAVRALSSVAGRFTAKDVETALRVVADLRAALLDLAAAGAEAGP